jgi:hypothetical protein
MNEMIDQEVIVLVINAIPGSKTVTVGGRKFEFDTVANGAVEKRFARFIKKLPHPINFTVRRYLEDTYLEDAGKIKQWSVIYGLQLNGQQIYPIPGETMKRSRKKMEGVVFETPDLHALLARLIANAAGEIGKAGSDAFKAAIKSGGECEDACEAAINAAAEAAIRKIKDA